MKKLITLMLLVAGAIGYAFCQPVLPYGTHEPTYYYWDDWYDTSPDFAGVETRATHHFSYGAPIMLHKIYTNRPLRVKGIAAALNTNYTDCEGFRDTAHFGRVPEYFRLYNASPTDFTLLAEKQWDSSNIRYVMEVRGTIYSFMEFVYEVQFDSVFELTDSFYVGTTMFNNLGYLVGESWEDEHYYYPNYHTMLATLERRDKTEPRADPPLYKFRYTKLDSHATDTSIWHYANYSNRWPMLFPVIDTTRTCSPASELTATPLENASAALTWSSASSPQAWDIAYGHTGCSPSARSSRRVATPYVTLSNLDTNTWYTAFVRAVCDIGDYSYWSDSVTFYIPGSNDTSLVDVGIVEQLTRLMPNPAAQQLTIASSFGVRLVELYALDGKLLDKIPLDGSPIHYLDVSAYPAGSYIVRITTSQGPIAKKLLIAHP